MDFGLQLQNVCQQPLTRLPRPAPNETHVVITNDDDMLRVAQWAHASNLYLCSMIVNDERMLESHAFKIYYLFSAPTGNFLIVEYMLPNERPMDYVSIREYFPSVQPLERKSYDLYGVSPLGYEDTLGRFVLHEAYPNTLFPLRRTREYANLARRQVKSPITPLPPEPPYPPGMLVLPVGPIHAGIIEAGHFPFAVAGEVIEDVPLRLGYKHRGIEKLLESSCSLENGWQLVGKIAGDASFAHSMAYCRAVESLGRVQIPPQAQRWRALFLELERIYNHIADVAALASDIALDIVASEMAVLRETAVQLNYKLCRHRLLHGINRPGGVFLHPVPDVSFVSPLLREMQETFAELSHLLLEMPSCRDRMLTTGMLTREDAAQIGATGIIMRATGNLAHDFRIRHPYGCYQMTDIQDMLKAVVPQNRESVDNLAGVYKSDLQGDVFARLALRVAEVHTSIGICCLLAEQIQKSDDLKILSQTVSLGLANTPNFEFGIGYAESWRGDVFYWVMKGPNHTIFRCKVRDPSVFNWPALRLATQRKSQKRKTNRFWENILADFPLVNKSFNLSYAANDL